jgi:hypothetical protein
MIRMEVRHRTSECRGCTNTARPLAAGVDAGRFFALRLGSARRAFTLDAKVAAALGVNRAQVGAVYGQLAGAIHLASGIPRSWLDRVALGAHIVALADALIGGSGPPSIRPNT